MKQVIIFSGLLLSGILVSQFSDLSEYRDLLNTVTLICLSYIMIEVGLDFEIDKKRLKSYGRDYLVAAGAATVPWIFASLYFMIILGVYWKEAFLIGRFAAPTSAGVLLSMLIAAGLGSTWIFQKVRTLAIFDDLDSVFFMIPLQIIIMEFQLGCFTIILVIIGLLALAYRWLHWLKWPNGKLWLLGYSVLVFLLSEIIKHTDLIHHLEVLVPAFVLGCVLYKKQRVETPKTSPLKLNRSLSEKWEQILDYSVKMLFMFLVGCSIPKIAIESMPISIVTIHVLILTVLCNIGKCFPILGYVKDVPINERVALSIALFPRGEVGAGILVIALGYGFGGLPATLAGLSLASS